MRGHSYRISSRVAAVFCLALAQLFARAQDPPPQPEPESQPETIRVDVNLTTLRFTV